MSSVGTGVSSPEDSPDPKQADVKLKVRNRVITSQYFLFIHPPAHMNIILQIVYTIIQVADESLYAIKFC